MHRDNQVPGGLGERMEAAGLMGTMELKDSLDPEELKALLDLKAMLASDAREPLDRQVQQANVAREALEDEPEPMEKMAHPDRRDRRAQQGRPVRWGSPRRR